MKRKSAFKIRRSELDDLFSRYIRARDKWICQRCGKYKAIVKDDGKIVAPGLDCAHFIKRRNQATRFDPDNCDALCSPGCHQYFHENEDEYKIWKRLRLGNVRYELLQLRAREHKKRYKADVEMVRLWLEIELKRLEAA